MTQSLSNKQTLIALTQSLLERITGRSFKSPVWLIIMAMVLSGCAANPFAESYVETPDLVFATKRPAKVSNDEAVRLVKVSELTDEIVQSAKQQGYVLLGSSTFVRSTPVRESLVLNHARSVGSDLVFIAKTYSHSEAGLAAVTAYKPGTNSISTTSGTISVYGNSTSALANYSSTTATTSSGAIETTYLPTTYQYSRFTAWFFGRKGN